MIINHTEGLKCISSKLNKRNGLIENGSQKCTLVDTDKSLCAYRPAKQAK